VVDASRRVAVDEGVPFGSKGGRELRADVYRPPPGAALRPGILLVHGGSWFGGEPAMMRGYCILMARQGYPCVASEYRLTGEAKWPAQIDDVHAAIRWMREKGPDFGIDPERLVLWGQSAGAHLTLLAAAQIANDGGGAHGASNPIAACVNYYPATSLEAGMGKAWEHAQALLPGASAEQWRAMSPLGQAGAGFPPTLLLHGGNDDTVATDQSLRLFESLRAAGVPVDLHVYAGQPHGFDLDRTFARHSVEVISLFLSRYAALPETEGE
jgi:acetyl esterase/lipase